MIQEKLQNALSRIFDQTDGTEDEVPHEVMDDDMDFLDDIVTEVPGAAAATNSDMLFSFMEKKKRFLTPMN
jgi:hypothetical protein